MNKKIIGWDYYFYLGVLKYTLIYPKKLAVEGFVSMEEIKLE